MLPKRIYRSGKGCDLAPHFEIRVAGPISYNKSVMMKDQTKPVLKYLLKYTKVIYFKEISIDWSSFNPSQSFRNHINSTTHGLFWKTPYQPSYKLSTLHLFHRYETFRD